MSNGYVDNITTDTGLFKDDLTTKLVDTKEGEVKSDLGDGKGGAITDTLEGARSTTDTIDEASIEGFLATFSGEDNAARTGSNIGNDTRAISPQSVKARGGELLPDSLIAIGDVGKLTDALEHDKSSGQTKITDTTKLGSSGAPVTVSNARQVFDGDSPRVLATKTTLETGADKPLTNALEARGEAYFIKDQVGISGKHKSLEEIHKNVQESFEELGDAGIEGLLITFSNETNSERKGSNIGNDTRQVEGQDVRSRIPSEQIRVGNVGKLEDAVIHDGKDTRLKQTVKVEGRSEQISTTLQKLNSSGQLQTADDIAADGSFYKRINSNEKTGAGNAYSHLDSSGLKTGAAIGDAIKSTVIWSDYNIVRTAGVSVAANSPILENTEGYMRKAIAIYTHDSDIKNLTLKAQMKTDVGLSMTGYMRLSLYEITTTGGFGTNKGNSTAATVSSTTYTEKETTLALGGLTQGKMYYATIEMQVSTGANPNNVSVLNPVITCEGA